MLFLMTGYYFPCCLYVLLDARYIIRQDKIKTRGCWTWGHPNKHNNNLNPPNDASNSHSGSQIIMAHFQPQAAYVGRQTLNFAHGRGTVHINTNVHFCKIMSVMTLGFFLHLIHHYLPPFFTALPTSTCFRFTSLRIKCLSVLNISPRRRP